MEKECRIVVSKDGTSIWAEAVGTPSKPAVIFIHGFSCTGAAFDKQFCDPEMLSNLYMVRFPYPRYGLLSLLTLTLARKIRYEVRGHGRSDQPLAAESYESIHHAEDFKGVCDAFNVIKPFIAGWLVTLL